MSSEWCSTPSGGPTPTWDGIDLSVCFQKRLAGIVAATVVAASTIALVGACIHSLIRRDREDEVQDLGERIGQAENEALRELISREGVAGGGGGEGWMRRASELWVICGAVGVVLALQGARGGETPGRGWDGVVLAAWLWTLGGAVAKLLLVAGPNSAFAAVLDASAAFWILGYTLLSGISLRTSLIDHRNIPSSFATFTLTLTSALVILLRPAQSSSCDVATTAGLPPPLGTNSSILSNLTFSYLSPLLYTHAVTPLTLSSLPSLPPLSRTPHVLLKFRLLSPPTSSISLRILYHFRWRILQQQMWALVGVATVAVPPMCLKGLLGHIAREDEPRHLGWLWAVGMAASMAVKTVASGQALWIGTEIGIQVKAILTSEIFAKALRRKEGGGGVGAAKEESDEHAEGESKGEEDDENAASGKILNLISTDAPNATYVSSYLHHIWSETTLTIVVTVFLLFQVIGLAALAGLAALLLLMPLQAFSSKFFYKSQERISVATDARLTLVAEVLSAVRAIKYFAWEKKFLAKMAATREKELDALWSRASAFVTSTIILFGAPVFVSVATFTCQTQLLSRELTAEVAFTSLALFNVLRGPLETLIDTSARYMQAFISLQRIDKFLQEDETEKYHPVSPSVDVNVPAHPVVGFINGSFSYSSSAEDTSFRLTGLELEFPVGKTSLVVGPVGSGKTTLLLSLLSETTTLSGQAVLPSHPRPSSFLSNPSLVLTDSTAYCSQSPWLLNDSIRNNIVFGSTFDEKRYGEVLDACALRVDLKQFGLSDGAEVGERGTVVSGGQKARISLARALYSSAKFLLLDDILSSVDGHTAQHIVAHALQGPLMRHRTCILVTHAVDTCLPLADFVVYLKEGQVVSSGAPEKVALPPPKEKVVEVQEEEAVKTLEDLEAPLDEDVFKPIQEEKQSQGAAPFAVYWVHIKAMGGLWMVFGALACFLAAQLCEIGVSLTLRYWAASYDVAPSSGASLFHFASSTPSTSSALASTAGTSQHSTNYWLTLYISLGVLNTILFGVRVGYFLRRGIVASRTLYESLIARILGSPIRFFDSVHSGVILNRLSNDTETIDQELAPTELFLLVEVFSAVGIIFAISAVLPAFLVAAFFVTVLYALIGYVYIATSRELQRCGAVTRSPFFSTFTESLHGVVTLRAYGDTLRFLQKFITELDTNNRVVLTIWQANRWLSIRVDCAGALVTFCAAGFALLSLGMDAALAGFILSFAVTFNDHMLQVVQMAGFLQLDINSIERISEYLELPQESVAGSAPPAIWPSRDGTLEVRNLVASYAPGILPALNDISFSQKIGICGRTGSGKSTLGLSVFRFIEATSGQILLDGLDIATLQLQKLRARLTIVTQETTLFAGSIRENLDPFRFYEDGDIWEVLEKVTLTGATRESGVVKSLEMPVAEGGKNLSAGQRQLLSLARGLLKLRSSSLLILDEATGSLDQATDDVIQSVIREELSDVTVLCIAHRLQSICDYDKILVLSDGKVLEFDTPWALLTREDSAFTGLCRKSGDFEEITRLVQAKQGTGRVRE